MLTSLWVVIFSITTTRFPFLKGCLFIYYRPLFFQLFDIFLDICIVIGRCPQWECRILSRAGQRHRFDGGSEEKEEDHLQPCTAVWAGAGLRCDPLPGHHPAGKAGRAHTSAWEQDTGEAAGRMFSLKLQVSPSLFKVAVMKQFTFLNLIYTILTDLLLVTMNPQRIGLL